MTSWVGNASEEVASVIAVVLMATSHVCPWLHIPVVLGDVFSLQVAIKRKPLVFLTPFNGGARNMASRLLAPRTGFEPVTYRLTAGRSTVELSRNRCS